PGALLRGHPHAHARGRDADRGQQAAGAEHRRQLRRPPGHRRGRALAGRGRCRGTAAPRADRRGRARRPRRPGRPAAAGPVHPHRRRLQDQQLPALAAGLHRAVVHRNAVARARRRDPAPGARRLCGARAPLRPHRRADRRPGPAQSPGECHIVTRTRVLAALTMAPLAIGAVLLLPTPWLVAVTAILFLLALWEWFRLSDIDDTLQRTVLLLANLLLMAALVWASPND